MSDIMQGLSISIVGLLITFFSLGVFILLMIVLQRIFPPKPKVEEVAEEGEPVIQVMLDQPDEEGEVVAAIAAAISHFQTENRPRLGANLESGRGRYWSANRSSFRPAISLKKK